MSRETDSSSSGPQGRGGAAYPSGTPPYGSRQYPSLHPTQDAPDEGAGAAPEPQPDEPKTETTLTTRIRINIPGSRPIPPVVMRTPMSDVDAKAAKSGKSGVSSSSPSSASTASSASSSGSVPGARPGDGESERTGGTPWPESPQTTQETPIPSAEPAGEDKAPTSDWFAPRKSPAPGPDASGSGPAPGSGPASGSGSVPGGTNGAGLAALAGQPSAPSGPSGPSAPGRPAAAERPGAGLPYFSDGGTSAEPGAPAGPAGNGFAPATSAGPAGNGFAPGRNTPPFGVRPPGASDRPAGPTAGPSTGSMPIVPRPGGSGPQNPGAAPGGPVGAPRMSDDTAILTPQQPAPDGGGHVSGDTLTSGIPVVSPEHHRSPFPPQGGPGTGPGTGSNPLAPRIPSPYEPEDFSAPEFAGGPGAAGGPVVPVPDPAETTPASRPAPPAKKGRSKLVLVGVGVFVLVGLAYGAGLLLNHSDVPKSTTVLGVDIGGGTKDEAVNKLDRALGKRAAAPLQLSVGGKKTQLAPDKAGLTLDSQATVRAAAGNDYNPVSVIGSLFGGERVAEPVIVVDEEKLGVALTDLAGVSGSATEGTINFVPGKAVGAPGKAGQTLDVGRSMISVKDAYRAQVETGKPNVVELPVATRQPTITQAEIDQAMKSFAEPAMSGLITIKAGGKQIQFGPAKSLPKILSMKPIDGKLVEVYDKQAIEELLAGVFDGIMITKGDGKQHEVTADDVAQAMGPALRGKTPAERTAIIALNPS
ncbi:hypothetical protein AB0M39_19140 [Streptomyces sp. NPDC051907]|uniref:hypothetical protein n=1 Tax=Streptomyces sp. NPDC051907 TaxID=3155284 RepID=UPI0034148D1A